MFIQVTEGRVDDAVGVPTFRNGTETKLMAGGGSDDAGDAEAGEVPTGDARRQVEGLRFLDLADPWLASP